VAARRLRHRQPLSAEPLGGQMKRQEGTDATSSAGAAEISCSFCQRSKDQARYLLTRPGVSICEMCVATCVDSIADSERAKSDRPAARGRLYRCVKALLWKGVPLPARIHCDLCRARVAIADSVPVARRGRLCPDCIAAVQEATRRDTKESH
jgi:hypothetical protein